MLLVTALVLMFADLAATIVGIRLASHPRWPVSSRSSRDPGVLRAA